MFDTILNLFAPYVLGALAIFAAWFGIQSKRNKSKADKATAEAMAYKQRADSMDAATKAQTAAQDAARGVPIPPKPDPKKRTGLGSRW